MRRVSIGRLGMLVASLCIASVAGTGEVQAERIFVEIKDAAGDAAPVQSKIRELLEGVKHDMVADPDLIKGTLRRVARCEKRNRRSKSKAARCIRGVLEDNAADRLLIVEFDRKQGADGSLTVDVQARSFGILDGVESEATDTCAECAEDKLGEVTQKTVASLLGIEFKAPPEPARLAITTTPPAATVSIDGREVGQSGTVHEVEPGWRTVEARLDGHKPAQSRVEAKEGETLPVNLDLEVEKPAGTGNDGNGAKTGNGQNGNSNGTQQPSVPADDSSWGTLKTLVVGAGATGVVVGLGYLGINGRTWGLENEEYRTWDEGLLIGGIGLAVAVGGYLLLPNKNSSEPTSGVSLRVSGDGIGVGYSGRF